MGNYFKKYKNHETVKLYNKLCQNIRDISFFINLALCHSNPPELNTIADLKNSLKGSFEPDFPYREFINSIKQFYEDTNFEYFFEGSKNEYEKMINDYGNRDEVENYVKTIDDYLGNNTKNYTVIISALLMGNFGIEILTKENVKLNYSVLSPWYYKDNAYIFGPKNLIKEYLWHEISHLTINDLTKRHINRFNIHGKTIPEDFAGNLYTDMETVINEYIIRALTIRLFEINREEKSVEYLLQDNIKRGFKQIESIKNYISENSEKNNRLLKDETYIELMNYVIHKGGIV